MKLDNDFPSKLMSFINEMCTRLSCASEMCSKNLSSFNKWKHRRWKFRENAKCLHSYSYPHRRSGRACAIGSSKMFVYKRGWGWQCLSDERKCERERTQHAPTSVLQLGERTRSRVEKSFLISSLESPSVGCGCLFMVSRSKLPHKLWIHFGCV